MVVDVQTVCAVSIKEEAVLVREIKTISYWTIADCNGSLFSMTCYVCIIM